jgi:hypothetical protein
MLGKLDEEKRKSKEGRSTACANDDPHPGPLLLPPGRGDSVSHDLSDSLLFKLFLKKIKVALLFQYLFKRG